MSLPLYKELHQNTALRFDTNGHSGLWFERFYNAYLPTIQPREEYSKAEKDTLIKQEEQWLKAFQQHNSQIGNTEALKHHARKQVMLVQALKGEFLVCQTQWHFVTGMGLPHPIENGITWHPTLGVPYLTGAAIKGIVRTWLSTWDTLKDKDNQEDKEKQRERLWRWFGSEYKTPDDLKEAKKEDDFSERDNQTGYLSFFDAFPVKSPQLGLDIITPHAGKWYAEGGNINDTATESDKIPADWHDPIPVKFLVIKDAQFLFSVAPRNQQCAKKLDMKEVQQALQEALTWLGAGAKTAVGYGAFEIDENAKEYLKKGVEKYKEKAKKPMLIAVNLDSLSDNQKVLEQFKQDIKKVKQEGNIKDKYSDLVGLGNKFIKKVFNLGTEEKQQAISLLNEYFNTIGWHQPTLTGSENKEKRNKQKAKKQTAIKGLETP